MSDCIQTRKSWLFRNTANIITMIGFCLCPFLFWVIIMHPEKLGFIFTTLLIVYYTDFLDGQVARRFEIVSDFGGAIDRLRDKLCAAAVFTLLLTSERFGFVWLITLPIILVEILLLVLMFVGMAKGLNVSANIFGKIRFFSFSIVTMLLILVAMLDDKYGTRNLALLANIFFGLFVWILVFTILSLVVHFKKFRLQLQAKNSVNH